MMGFISPTKGKLEMEEMYADIIKYIEAQPDATYKVIIGSDSQGREEACFVTAVIIHKVGKGARYYYRKIMEQNIYSLRQKIFYETALSLHTASEIAKVFAKNGHQDLDVEIHLDVGSVGKTKELIREIVGMVVGSGFDAKIKPDACGATKVADKHTK